jgi:hypothetical protein
VTIRRPGDGYIYFDWSDVLVVVAVLAGFAAVFATAYWMWPTCGPHVVQRDGDRLWVLIRSGTWPACRTMGPYSLRGG